MRGSRSMSTCRSWGIEHEQACSRERGNGRGSARPPQRRDLAEEMTGAEPNALVLELNLHFSGGD